MIRLGKPIGFVVGILLGITTRDNYLYPYPLRTDDLEEEYKQYTKEATAREKHLNDSIAKMEAQLEKAMGVYVKMKH